VRRAGKVQDTPGKPASTESQASSEGVNANLFSNQETTKMASDKQITANRKSAAQSPRRHAQGLCTEQIRTEQSYTEFVPALTFTQARDVVLREVHSGMEMPAIETADLNACAKRVLAQDALADRDLPPFHRSMRDGFAIRAADIPGHLRLIGEVRAGQTFSGQIRPGEAVEIMTGAPLPEGADAVVMVEHCVRHTDGAISTSATLVSGDNVSPAGCEARVGSVILTRGARLDYASIACLASVGQTSVLVFTRPRVAILATGDEIIDVADTPSGSQIRNSNSFSLAAQVERAGGIPIVLPTARDSKEHVRILIEQGLTADLLLLSGGVSAGKYDIVEPVLSELGATFFFDRVLIQPGQPVVFGKVRNRFFFGLPGNPASTMVTFEILARAAIDLLSGATCTELPLALARLTQPFHHRPGLTRFLPASVRGAEVTPVASKGSGDIPALCRANAYLVADSDKADYAAGDLISILFK
jgi:molybdopterin molybdotransferase